MTIMDMVAKIKVSTAEKYMDKYSLWLDCLVAIDMSENEPKFWPKVYSTAQEELSKEYDTQIIIETSVDHGRGCISAITENGAGECIAKYSFARELEALWEVFRNFSGRDAQELLEDSVYCIVQMVRRAAGN